MSRIGKQLISLTSGVTAKAADGFIYVQGPKGELKQEIHPQVLVTIDNDAVSVRVKDENEKSQRALWGLYGSLIKNMVLGVTQGFSKKMEITGVGFNAVASGKKLTLKVGFSHPVEFAAPEGIEIKTEGNAITVSGIDKQLVGETAARIRKIKKPEPYKGKGIKYAGEQIRRKAGKTAAKATK